MLELAGRRYENVEFQSPLYSFDQLCETAYLTGVFAELRSVMGRAFDERHFIIFSGPDSNDLDVGFADPAKTVVLHISDETSSVPYALCARVRAVFKSYLRRELLVANLHSLPLGYVASTPDFQPIPISDRRQNVFFSGNLNTNRVRMLKALATPRLSPVPFPPRLLSFLNPALTCDGFVPRSYIRFTSGFRGGLSGDEYARHLVNSKVVLCPRGWHSSETFRHFEAMRAGAILLSEELPPLRFYLGSPILIIRSWYDLRGLISELLASPGRLVERQEQTLAWWREACSESATAARIADVIA